MENIETTFEPEYKHKSTINNFFSETALYWEQIYEELDGNTRSYDNYSMNKRMNTTLELLDAYADNRQLTVLDAGCGPGVVLNEICKRGHRAEGIDVSTAMVDEANTTLAKFGVTNAHCQTGDIEALPFENNSFEVVVSLGVLMYLSSDHKALLEISRVVKPGGMVLLVLPNLTRLNMLLDPYYIYRAAMYAWHKLPKVRLSHNESLVPMDVRSNKSFTNRRYLHGQLSTLFAQYGFMTTRIIGVDYSPMTLWGKHILSADKNISISERLASISELKGFGWLNRLANQWVISLKKL